jgi:hypothetical protein
MGKGTTKETAKNSEYLQIPQAKTQSEHAPFLYIDAVSNQGYRNGVASMTLEALRHFSEGDTVMTERVVVAHLRLPLTALDSLQAAINAIRLMTAEVASRTAN